MTLGTCPKTGTLTSGERPEETAKASRRGESRFRWEFSPATREA